MCIFAPSVLIAILRDFWDVVCDSSAHHVKSLTKQWNVQTAEVPIQLNHLFMLSRCTSLDRFRQTVMEDLYSLPPSLFSPLLMNCMQKCKPAVFQGHNSVLL